MLSTIVHPNDRQLVQPALGPASSFLSPKGRGERPTQAAFLIGAERFPDAAIKFPDEANLIPCYLA
jgi:hypothetical protein